MGFVNKLAWFILLALILCKALGWTTITWLPIIIYGGILLVLNIFVVAFVVLVAAAMSYEKKHKNE
ncbi:hypothetical protein FC56_GL000269 [Lentilactobacillus senioris DSM 24302 = JCM 17472]|uniref:Uncharacterized protein n=1 Tax=Lentilactobacillus senioris DSM 24302 = JCM 17472 TaxID=1423802 RepID=A0A0R2CV51_9LACO|nr:hypothetical protein [Lentilactobacillus senioris]KRM93556.1 hypothetical protein FC56_GL000269 [Lentilactobacillus senioris DSM 24302 = JCM 17472]